VTAQVGVAYSSGLAATGGVLPHMFSIVSGSLSPGLTVSPSPDAIRGTPTTVGTSNFTAQVVDSAASEDFHLGDFPGKGHKAAREAHNQHGELSLHRRR
jgi:hypothetical protein